MSKILLNTIFIICVTNVCHMIVEWGEKMKYIFIAVCAFVIICVVCSCQPTPNAKQMNGILVQTENIEEVLNQSESVDYKDMQNIFYSEKGEININGYNIVSDNIDSIYKGTLNIKSYSIEELQGFFCPNSSLEEIEYGDGVRCWVDYNEEHLKDSVKWKQSIMICSEPFNGFSYTYYPVDERNERLCDQITLDSDKLEKYKKQIDVYITGLKSNFQIDHVTCYGNGTENYYDFELALTLDGIRCFDGNRNSNDTVSYGDIQISEKGLGSIRFHNDFSVKEKQKATVLSVENILQILDSYVKSKTIVPYGTVNINLMQLEFKIGYEEGEFLFYPVWSLKTEDETGRLVTYIAINAETGEVEYYIGR